MNNKTKNILRWLPSIVIGLFVTMSATFKLTGLQPLVEHFTELHLLQYLKLFGTMELVFMALFLNPRTTRFGLLLLTAYFGGAIATELPYGSYMAGPVIILCMVWVAAAIREPVIFKEIIQQKKIKPTNDSLQLS